MEGERILMAQSPFFRQLAREEIVKECAESMAGTRGYRVIYSEVDVGDRKAIMGNPQVELEWQGLHRGVNKAYEAIRGQVDPRVIADIPVDHCSFAEYTSEKIEKDCQRRAVHAVICSSRFAKRDMNILKGLTKAYDAKESLDYAAITREWNERNTVPVPPSEIGDDEAVFALSYEHGAEKRFTEQVVTRALLTAGNMSLLAGGELKIRFWLDSKRVKDTTTSSDAGWISDATIPYILLPVIRASPFYSDSFWSMYEKELGRFNKGTYLVENDQLNCLGVAGGMVESNIALPLAVLAKYFSTGYSESPRAPVIRGFKATASLIVAATRVGLRTAQTADYIDWEKMTVQEKRFVCSLVTWATFSNNGYDAQMEEGCFTPFIRVSQVMRDVSQHYDVLIRKGEFWPYQVEEQNGSTTIQLLQCEQRKLVLSGTMRTSGDHVIHSDFRKKIISADIPEQKVKYNGTHDFFVSIRKSYKAPGHEVVDNVDLGTFNALVSELSGIYVVNKETLETYIETDDAYIGLTNVGQSTRGGSAGLSPLNLGVTLDQNATNVFRRVDAIVRKSYNIYVHYIDNLNGKLRIEYALTEVQDTTSNGGFVIETDSTEHGIVEERGKVFRKIDAWLLSQTVDTIGSLTRDARNYAESAFRNSPLKLELGVISKAFRSRYADGRGPKHYIYAQRAYYEINRKLGLKEDMSAATENSVKKALGRPGRAAISSVVWLVVLLVCLLLQFKYSATEVALALLSLAFPILYTEMRTAEWVSWRKEVKNNEQLLGYLKVDRGRKGLKGRHNCYVGQHSDNAPETQVMPQLQDLTHKLTIAEVLMNSNGQRILRCGNMLGTITRAGPYLHCEPTTTQLLVRTCLTSELQIGRLTTKVVG